MKFTDLSSADFYRDPYPLYQRLRDEGRLVPIAPNTFITGHYDIIHALLVDRNMGKGYLDSIRVRYGEEGVHQPAIQAMSRMFLMMNPPAHTRLRALLMKAFNARQIDLLREVTQAVADELIDALPADRPFDLVSAHICFNLACKQGHESATRLRQEIAAEERAMTLLHIEQFDGKNIGGAAQLFERENQRRGVTFAPPPESHGAKFAELAAVEPAEKAQHVEVGVLVVIFADLFVFMQRLVAGFVRALGSSRGIAFVLVTMFLIEAWRVTGGGTVQYDSFKVRSERCVQALDQFGELFFFGQRRGRKPARHSFG